MRAVSGPGAPRSPGPRGRFRRLGVVAALLAAPLLLAAPAQGITRARANAIAVQALKPKNERSPVILFGLPKPLKAGQIVSEPARAGLLKRPGRKAWLFWEDRHPNAMFEHESIALLVDDATGRVVRRAAMRTYPLIDGRQPPWLRSPTAYNGRAYHVFASRPPPARLRSSAPTRQPVAIAPGAFAGDCILLVVLTPGNGTEESNELAGLAAWSGLAASLGVPAYVATAAGPLEAAGPLKPPSFEGQVDDAGLLANVKALVDQEKCTDVTVYVSGHGAEAPAPPSIQLAVETLSTTSIVGDDVAETKELTPAGLAAAAAAVGAKAKLKWILDTCYADRMTVGLDNPASLIVLGSSAPTEPSYFNLNGSVIWGVGVATPVPNPGMPEFTHGMIEGIRAAAAAPGQVSDFAGLLDAAFDREQDNDKAAKDGTTHPVRHRPGAVPSIDCAGTLSPYGSGGMEVVFRFSCATETGPGRAALAGSITRFDVQLPGTRTVTNYLAPAGFSCAAATRTRTNDTLRCTGSLALGATVEGNIRMTPAPSNGMGASLFVLVDGREEGPFDLGGP